MSVEIGVRLGECRSTMRALFDRFSEETRARIVRCPAVLVFPEVEDEAMMTAGKTYHDVRVGEDVWFRVSGLDLADYPDDGIRDADHGLWLYVEACIRSDATCWAMLVFAAVVMELRMSHDESDWGDWCWSPAFREPNQIWNWLTPKQFDTIAAAAELPSRARAGTVQKDGLSRG